MFSCRHKLCRNALLETSAYVVPRAEANSKLSSLSLNLSIAVSKQTDLRTVSCDVSCAELWSLGYKRSRTRDDLAL